MCGSSNKTRTGIAGIGGSVKTPPRNYVLSKVLHVSRTTVNNIVKGYLSQGIACFYHKKRSTPPVEGKIEGEVEAKISLYFELFDLLKNYVVKLYSRKHKAHITTDLIDFLRAQDGATVRINNRLVEDLVTVQEETAEDEEMLDAADMLPDD